MTDIHLCSARRHSDTVASYHAAIEENSHNQAASSPGSRKKRAVGTFSRFWANGRTLKIGFTDNDLPESHKQAIIDAINQWQPYVNLTFVFVDGREGAPEYGKGDIRITTDTAPSLNYTLIGTDAKLNDPWTPTMVLGVRPTDDKFKHTVMHEFGHALGAEHEHQHPQANIPWDLPAVYAYYAAAGHSKEAVDESVLTKLEQAETTFTTYDKESIMHYAIPSKITLGDWEVGINRSISTKDKELMRKVYPKS